MEFGGRYLFSADRKAVWEALNNTAVLKSTIPGCSRIEWVSDSELDMEIKVNLGVAKPVFAGGLTLSNVDPAESYTLSGQGKGGLLGLAHGAADIVLTDAETGTILCFSATGGASGRLLSLGKSIIGASAQKVIDGFFERFGEAMGVSVMPLPEETAPGSST